MKTKMHELLYMVWCPCGHQFYLYQEEQKCPKCRRTFTVKIEVSEPNEDQGNEAKTK